jgi:hypothetical protein
MRGLVALPLAVLVAACGGGPAPAPASPPAPPVAATEAFPPGVPFLAPGERTVYRIRLHEVEVATYTVVCGDLTELDGRPVVVVEGGVQSSPLVSLVRKVEDHFTSWIDAATSRTLLFRAEERVSPDRDAIEYTDAEVGTISDGTFAIRVHAADEPEVVERQTVGLEPPFDLNSLMIALRSWIVPVGTTVTADAIRSRFLWRTTVTMAGYEEVVTELGPIPAVRLEGESHRLGRDGTIDPAVHARRYRLWISDDADRVPLRVVAFTDYGEVTMEIIEYHAGGARLGA